MKAPFSLFLAAAWPLCMHAQSVDVLPVRISEGARSLNGEWQFKYLPSSDIGGDENFFQPSFDAGTWKKIPVPAHWELHAFAEPEYADDLKEGTGLYRRTFHVAKEWQGQRVFLRFDGVLYGFTAYVNGHPVGEWASSFHPTTFDITDALLPGDGENVLAVRVTTRSKGWNFDNMDCWSLSGIFRDVTLFALPQIHFKDYTARTTLKPDGTATLHLDAVASAAATVSGRLLSPDGKLAKEFNLPLASAGNGSIDLDVNRPQLWTAETPSLYRLELNLQSGDKTVQRFTDRVGLRQITVEDGVLKLNGTPIKLRGIDHHDIWPEEGRVATEENMRRDLELIRAANINFIRTSHYPPHPRFIEMCDEMGIYVDDEVPYIHGRKNLKDPSYQDVLLTRARATVMRDKNRPSVIYWSCGNENPVTELGNNTGRFVKALDPTRPFTFPTMGSQFPGYLEKFPDSMELYAAHYPSTKQARKYAETLQKPIVFTEYAHQRGLARGGIGVQDLWEIFYKSPRIAGGAVWLFQDQGLLRTAEDRQSVKDGDLMVWLDEHRYYDTHGFYAMDGIVYSDRTPQVDYWQVRKVYSPVQIQERSLTIKPGAQTLPVHVENRHDFRTLAEMKLQWALQKNGTTVQSGVVALTAKPKETETVSIDASLPQDLATDVFTLELRCQDEGGHQLHERTLRLDPGTAEDSRSSALLAALPQTEAGLDISESLISVRHANHQLKLNRQTGQLSLLDPNGATVVSEFGPNMGHHPTINDIGKTRERLPELWCWGLLHEVTELKTDAHKLPEGIEIIVSGNYPRPNKPEESIRGQYRLLVTRTGAIDVSYSYTPVNISGEVLEAGFALSVPPKQSELRWLGQGPYAGYPGKDRLNEYGIFHLTRDDLYFAGNRRGVEFASLADHSGTGVLLIGNGMTLDLEKVNDTTLFSHVALVPGAASADEGKSDTADAASKIKAASIKNIEGKFTLLPLGANWPEPLKKWFGSPEEQASVHKAFLHSYDQ
jgi:beta-galactosidase